jgi:hypothetical protein
MPDLEDADERTRLSSPLSLADHESQLVILDEVQRVPELFQLAGDHRSGTAAGAKQMGDSFCSDRPRRPTKE